MSGARPWHLAALLLVAVAQAVTAAFGLFMLWGFLSGEVGGPWWLVLPCAAGMIVAAGAGHISNHVLKLANRP
jgi:hypothetical protein